MRIFEIVSKMNKMNLSERRAFLMGELRKEKPNSIRGGEIQKLLTNATTKVIRKETRAA